jgi:hypothetical protein
MNGAVALFLMVDFPTIIFTTLQYSYVSKFLMVTVPNASKLCTIGFSVPDPMEGGHPASEDGPKSHGLNDLVHPREADPVIGMKEIQA